jgi:hypothetical protein
MRRSLRYLRIAFSVTCGIVAVLLCLLWVRSYWKKDTIFRTYSNGMSHFVTSNNGAMHLSPWHISLPLAPFKERTGWKLRSNEVDRKLSTAWGLWPSGRIFVLPYLLDRPGTAQVITANKELRDFLESTFAGIETGHRVRWDNAKPINIDGGAETYPPYQGGLCEIRVSNDSSYSAIDKCALLVFELHNAKSDSQSRAVDELAYKGQMSRNDFARRRTQKEFESGRKTRDFFRQHPLVPSSRLSRKENPQYHDFLSYPDNFSNYLNSPDGTWGAYLFQYYGECYDEMIRVRDSEPITVSGSLADDLLAKSRKAASASFAEEQKKQNETYFDQLMGPPKDGGATAADVLKLIDVEKTEKE